MCCDTVQASGRGGGGDGGGQGRQAIDIRKVFSSVEEPYFQSTEDKSIRCIKASVKSRTCIALEILLMLLQDIYIYIVIYPKGILELKINNRIFKLFALSPRCLYSIHIFCNS